MLYSGGVVFLNFLGYPFDGVVPNSVYSDAVDALNAYSFRKFDFEED